MKAKSIIAILMVIVFLSVLTGLALSEHQNRTGISPVRMMARTLNRADCPLDESQIEQIKALERGPEFRAELMNILTAEQQEALKGVASKMRGAAQRRGGMMMARTLNRAGCPFDESQIEQIKALERGPEFRAELMNILTAEQQEALKGVASKMRGAAQRRGGMMMARTLNRAECPLDESQIEQIKALERGPEFRDNMMSILTAEQQEALKNGPKGRHGAFARGTRGRKIAGVLKNAGCALSEEQIQSIRSIEPSTSRMEQMKSILTSEQKSALENFFDEGGFEESDNPTSTDIKPESFNQLKQNYPNPFNPSTTIDYSLAEPGHVSIETFSANGQRVATLVDNHENSGWHSVVWDASSLAGGVYVCRITTGDFSFSRKMTLVK